uniref:hypothetical protein n=1 Tax=Flavobacterium sp. TaxID=239 RepID=UPI00404AABCD
MKKTIFLLLLPIFALLFSCKSGNETAVDLIFEQTSKIEILAYVDRDLWDEEDNPDFYEVNFIKNKKVDIKDKYLKNKIVLNNQQIVKLKKGLSDSCESFSLFGGAKCYDPRHAIIFYNNKSEVLGYIEICFECEKANSSYNLKILEDCALQLEELFKEFGITYF